MRFLDKAGATRRRSRRAAVGLLAAGLTASAAVTGCSASGSGGGGGTTVTVWSWRSQDAPLWQTVQSDLAKQGTNVTIQFRAVNPTSYDSVLQTAMNGGSGPDIFYDRGGEGTQTYGAAGLAAPLDKFVDTSTISPSSWAQAQYKGKTYGVPFAIQTMSVLYNKDLMAKYHLGVPKTWDEWMGEMRTLKGKGVTPLYFMGVQQWMLALQIDAVGASTMNDQFTSQLTQRKAKYTDSPYVKTLAAFQQLAPYLEDNWQSTGSGGNEQQTQFALGKAAFDIDGIFDTAGNRQV
jgi:multiple sugar transport system substrate-binding protein/raffinose/stachyose/melibiose transport system substrate-binding protein